MTKVLIVWVITMLPYILYLRYKFKRDLHVLQMNTYRFDRFMKWFRENRKENFRIIDIIPVFAVIPIFANTGTGLEVIVYKVIFAISYIVLIMKRIKYKDKKKLVMTERARRIFQFAMVEVMIVAGVILWAYVRYYEDPTVTKLYILTIAEVFLFVEFTAASFMPILGANILLSPIEAAVKRKFYNQAKQILSKRKDLKIVGITGSYGKTSTKMIVSDILSEKFNVCRTPHSYNTLLGVVRTINEILRKTDEIFVVEMGAKQKGDIKEICDLVNPAYGILTAIGPQHLESFKTIENTKATKYELIESLGKDGKAVFNIDNKHIRGIVTIENLNNVLHDTICYSLEDEGAEYYAKNITYTNDGTTFTLVNEGKEIEMKTKLLGIYNIYNILAGVAVARAMGMDFDSIKEGVEKIKPIEHRLELKKVSGGMTIIDDAFNSNPEGAKMALDVLKILNGTRKIIVTPGMIELGDKQYELNNDFGVQCAAVCDYIILVGQKQTRPIQDALKNKGYDKTKIYIANDFTDANEHLKKITKDGDIVLFENDLLEDK